LLRLTFGIELEFMVPQPEQPPSNFFADRSTPSDPWHSLRAVHGAVHANIARQLAKPPYALAARREDGSGRYDAWLIDGDGSIRVADEEERDGHLYVQVELKTPVMYAADMLEADRHRAAASVGSAPRTGDDQASFLDDDEAYIAATSAGQKAAAEMVAKADKSRDPEAQIHAALAAVESAYGMRVNESCGMHVHVGLAGLGPDFSMKDTADKNVGMADSGNGDDDDKNEDSYAWKNGGFPLGTLRMLAVLVTCCEGSLNQLHPPHRQQNPYCRTPSQCLRDIEYATLYCTGETPPPPPSSSPPLDQLRRLAAQKSVRALYHAFNGGEGRYFAYNFENMVPAAAVTSTPAADAQLQRPHGGSRGDDNGEDGAGGDRQQQRRLGRGTIEFRQFSGSLDAAEIVARVRVALALVAFAHRFRHCCDNDDGNNSRAGDGGGSGDKKGIELMLAEALRFVPRWREPTAYDVLRGIGIGDLLPAGPGDSAGRGHGAVCDVTGGDRALEALFQRLPLYAVVVPRREDDMLPRVVCELARGSPASASASSSTGLIRGIVRRCMRSILAG
jgi:hypothetical protein